MKVRKFRVLRLRHGITLEELGDAAGISSQRISQLELSADSHNNKAAGAVRCAFLEIMASRLLELSQLELDYMKHQDGLFEAVEEDYEL